jgi:histidinol phosphatase-like PHP family hydrolase
MVDLGIRLTLSSDAHRPDDVGRNLQGACDRLVSKGVRELWFVRKRQATPIALV